MLMKQINKLTTQSPSSN